MSHPDLTGILEHAKSLRSSLDQIVSVLETAVTPKLATSQLPTNASVRPKPGRNADQNHQAHDQNHDELYANLSNLEREAKSIAIEVERLKTSLRPGGDGLSPRALPTQATTPARSANQRNATSMQRASASHTTEVETITREPADKNEFNTTAVPLLSGIQELPAMKGPTTAKEEHNRRPSLKDAKTLRFTCEAADLGDNMVRTIEKAIKALGTGHVNEYGYLILNVESLPAVDWDEVSLRPAKPQKGEILGFQYYRQTKGIANSLCVQPKGGFAFPDFSVPEPHSYHDNPEQDFQDTIDSPPSGQLGYYVGTPIHSLECTRLVHPGPKLAKRGEGDLPGINTPYWYISTCHGTPANLHIEDGRTGSVNLLLVGAPKDWLLVHPCSKSKLESCLRKQFPKPKSCAQFARHLDILLAPSWLRDRNIEYSVIRQHPGEMIVTLSDTYHQVKNCGKNLAVAINFEFELGSSMPEDYKWCTKSCGQYALTWEDFWIPSSNGKASQPPTNHSTLDHRPKAATTIEIPDDVPSEVASDVASDGGVAPIRCLPLADPDPAKDIDRLIAFTIKNRVPPGLLGCATVEETEKTLRMFLPGQWMSSTILRVLLQICCSTQFSIVESLKLEVSTPSLDTFKHLEYEDGLVFPFHVNCSDQASPKAKKNHWVLGIFDRRSMEFVSFGVDEVFTVKWALTLEKSMNDSPDKGRKIQYEAKPFPTNPENASCALVCCLALEKYLGLYPFKSEPPSLRSYYLRKLLSAVVFTNYHKDLTGESSKTLVRCNPSLLPDGLCDETAHSSATISENDALAQDLKNLPHDERASIEKALGDEECRLSLENRARIVQMIMECSNRALGHIRSLAQPADPAHGLAVPEGKEDVCKTMGYLLKKLVQNKDVLCLPIAELRTIYMQIAKTFAKAVEQERRVMKNDRIMQRRAPDGHKRKGQKPETRVLNRFSKAESTELSKRLKNRLRACINTGNNLDYLSSNLGLPILLTFPAATVDPTEFHLLFGSARKRFASLGKRITSDTYHDLKSGSDEAKYFIKHFAALKPELMHTTALDYRVPLHHAQLIDYKVDTQIQVVYKATKRPRDGSTATREGKKPRA